MLNVAHVMHRLGPALVGHQVEGDEFEPGNIGAGAIERVAHLVRPAQIAHAAANNVAGFEQLQGDMSAKETRHTSQKDAISHAYLH